jgi:hypothetical protein
MLKLTSKVMMWGSTKIRMCFCCPFFVRKTWLWTNHGQTVERPSIVVERPRVVVEQPRIVVDTAPPQKNHPNSALKVFHIYQCTFWDGLWTSCQSWKATLDNISLI